jgi:hypothetical protein
MTDRATVRNAIDQLTTDLFINPSAPATPVPVIFGNVTNVTLSEGTVPFLKQRVSFTSDKQRDLGNLCSRRHTGYVLFIIHVRKGTGDLARDNLIDRVTRGFRSRYVGPATTLDAQMVLSAESENWALTGIQIPFYFDASEE